MTIVVAFAHNHENSVPSVRKCQSRKHYSFNVDDTENIQEGDVLDLGESYSNEVRVIKVLSREYEYYHMDTGELSNHYYSTCQRPLKKIKLGSQNETVVHASKR